ncbi:hypothetical protein PENTCL1PPCAC_20993, partial [Pristionchus entomophagus]
AKELHSAEDKEKLVDRSSLKDSIKKNITTLENLLNFIDNKRWRRLWLRDVINFAQIAVKGALFISATLAVFYQSEQNKFSNSQNKTAEEVLEDRKQLEVFPLVTLLLSIAQGLIEGADQYFLKNKTTDEVKTDVLVARAGRA